MKVTGKVVVVTGAAAGIGRALCLRFAAEGARGVVAADIEGAGVAQVAEEIGGLAVNTDVADEAQVRELVRRTLERYGRVDLFCSNAGIVGGHGGPELSNEQWQRTWEVNVMAHVYAARAVIPAMIDQGGGYLLNTASAAGLLSTLGTAPYTVTKHAAVAFAEWIAITHAHQGIKVSCLCPQGVLTNMLGKRGTGALLAPGAITPEAVADSVISGLEREEFLILPHPEVLQYFRNRANDHERWLSGMRKLHLKFCGGGAA